MLSHFTKKSEQSFTKKSEQSVHTKVSGLNFPRLISATVLDAAQCDTKVKIFFPTVPFF